MFYLCSLGRSERGKEEKNQSLPLTLLLRLCRKQVAAGALLWKLCTKRAEGFRKEQDFLLFDKLPVGTKRLQSFWW